MSWWFSRAPNGGLDHDPNRQRVDVQENGRAENSSREGKLESEAGDFDSVVILKTPVNTPPSSSRPLQDPLSRSRPKSWPGEGAHPFSQNGTASTFSKSGQVTKIPHERRDGLDMQHSHLSGSADQDEFNKEQELVRPVQDITESSAAAPEGPNVNGESKQYRKRRQSGLRGKEAQLERLFWKALTSRAAVAEKRRELRAARLATEQIDEELMKILREKRTQRSSANGDFPDLENRYKRIQDARDNYGILEESYDTMEEKLDEDEYEITKLAEQLQSNDNGYTLPLEKSESDILSRTPDDKRSRDLKSDEKQEHPLYDEYLSLLGDADLVREDIDELRFEFEKLREAQLLRRKIHSSLSKNNQATIDNFFTKETALLEKLYEIELDAERLKQECRQAGLLDEGTEETVSSARKVDINNHNTININKNNWVDLNGLTEPRKTNGESDIVLQRSTEDMDEKIDILEDLITTTADREHYSLLLENPTEGKVEKDLKSLLSEFDPQDPGDRIARWILHRLRSSYIEVDLLHRVSVENGLDPPANMSKWQEDVLDFWFLDSTFLPPSAYQVQPSPTELQIPTSPFADRENKALSNSGQARLVHLVIRSSSLFDKLDFALVLRLTVPKGEVARSVR